MAKILIVQDSKSIGSIMRNLLESENFLVSIVETGEDAVKKAQTESFDLVLLDYGLPGMHGGQICRIFKEDVLLKPIPVVFMSAKPDKEMEKIVAEFGAQGFISEDFDIGMLVNIVNGYLQKNEFRSSSAGTPLDKQQAAAKLGIPQELYDDILKVFMQEAAETIVKIDESRNKKDFESLRQAAHFIKGSAGNLRIEEVYTVTKAIEYFDQGKDALELLDDYILRLKRAFAVLKNNI